MTGVIAVPTVDGIFPGVPEGLYHRDQGSLSSTGAKLLATKPPAVFRDTMLNGWAPKKVFDTGSLVHKLVLGEGADIVVVDAADWRTKAAQSARDEARDEGKVPVLTKDMEVAEAITDSVFEHDIAANLFSVGEPEVSIYGTDFETGVRMRGRVDWLRPDHLVDFKTTADSDPKAFERSIWKFGYAQQADWYLRIAREAGHQAQDFIFVAVSTKRPYLVSVHRLDDDYLAFGAEQNRKALRVFAECRETGVWPGYPKRINLVRLPSWAATTTPNYEDEDTAA